MIYLTFRSLKFLPHPSDIMGTRSDKQAVVNFDNNFGVSVVFGKTFYSNGVDTYEVAVLRDGEICYDSGISSDVLGYISREEVSTYMVAIQELEEGYIDPEMIEDEEVEED